MFVLHYIVCRTVKKYAKAPKMGFEDEEQRSIPPSSPVPLSLLCLKVGKMHFALVFSTFMLLRLHKVLYWSTLYVIWTIPDAIPSHTKRNPSQTRRNSLPPRSQQGHSYTGLFDHSLTPFYCAHRYFPAGSDEVPSASLLQADVIYQRAVALRSKTAKRENIFESLAGGKDAVDVKSQEVYRLSIFRDRYW